MPTYALFVFYKLKALTPGEEERTRREWEELKKKLPPGVRLTGEYRHAWGTNYNGIIVLEGEDFDKIHEAWHVFKEHVRWYVDETWTITTVKSE